MVLLCLVACAGGVRRARVTAHPPPQVQYSDKVHKQARAAMKSIVDYMARTTAQLKREARGAACV